MNLTEGDKQLIYVVFQYEIIAICSIGSHKSPVQLMIRGLVK